MSSSKVETTIKEKVKEVLGVQIIKIIEWDFEYLYTYTYVKCLFNKTECRMEKRFTQEPHC